MGMAQCSNTRDGARCGLAPDHPGTCLPAGVPRLAIDHEAYRRARRTTGAEGALQMSGKESSHGPHHAGVHSYTPDCDGDPVCTPVATLCPGTPDHHCRFCDGDMAREAQLRCSCEGFRNPNCVADEHPSIPSPVPTQEMNWSSAFRPPPDHYSTGTGIDPWAVWDAFDLDRYTANAVKYLLRAGKKDIAPRIDDLKKARDYVNKAIEREENK